MDFSVAAESFNTIKVQLRALGLITKSEKVRSVKDTQTYWSLTPYGDTAMTRLLAISRSSGVTASAQPNKITVEGPVES